MTVLTFPSSRGRDARDNLADYVERAKALTSFGPVDWDSPVWLDVDGTAKPRQTSGKTTQSLNFTIQGGARGTKQQDPIPRPLADFAKAFTRHREAERPTAVANHGIGIRAFRLLAQQMESVDFDPCQMLPFHFDEAANEARRTLSPDSAYGTGKALALIAKALAQYNISRARFEWSNTIRRPHSHDRITEEAVSRREAKLPSQAALDALPLLANMVEGDADTLRMRTIELLVCGGWRINELLSLPVDCEVEETLPDGTVRYGIIYNGEKGFGGTIKWIPSVMIDIAKRAIADIKRITAPIRADAEWMAANPGLVNIPALIDDLDRLVPLRELRELMGWSRGDYDAKLIKYRVRRIGDSVRAGDFVAALHAQTPVVTGRLPLHKHLFLIRDNMMHRQRGVVPASVRFYTSTMVQTSLVSIDDRKSIFEHYGFREPDGSPIQMTSHQFRHWLNTIAQEGGLQQELVARWSGRKDMSQNAAYDHVSGIKLVERVRGMSEKGQLIGSLASARDRLPPAERELFMTTAIGSAHVTEIGLCVHDWSLAPCPTHGDCANCGEHVIDKGNASQSAEAERQLVEVEAMLAQANAEVDDQTYGASRWQDAHRRRRDGLRAIVDIHRDTEIENGTLVHPGAREDQAAQR